MARRVLGAALAAAAVATAADAAFGLGQTPEEREALANATVLLGGNFLVDPVDGSLVGKGNVSATHLQFLVDDRFKQNVTFADKKKMLFNVLGLKVVDYAYTPEYQMEYAGESFFNGEPPHWYKSAYYRGILAESVAYKLDQALNHNNASCANLLKDDEVCCASLGDVDGDPEFRNAWYGKMDVVVTELVGAVQALAKMSFDPAGVAKLLGASAAGSGGPVSLGMFVGAVLEVLSKKSFGHYASAKSNGNGNDTPFEAIVESAAARVTDAIGHVTDRHLNTAAMLTHGFADLEAQREAIRANAEARLAALDNQGAERAAAIAELEETAEQQKRMIVRLNNELAAMETEHAQQNAALLARVQGATR